MKKSMKKMSYNEMVAERDKLRKELLNLRVEQVMSHLDNPLALRTVRTSMDELDCFEDEAFDSVVNPVSLNFVPDCKEVFTQVRRILVKDGLFLFGVANPIMYIFDVKGLERGRMRIRYTLPFSCDHSLSVRQRRRMAERGDTFEFSHSLQSLVGGLCAAGFAIEDFYSDTSGFEPVDSFVQDCYLAFLARAV